MRDRKLWETWLKGEGVKLYRSFNQQERDLLRIGLFAGLKTMKHEAEVIQSFTEQEGRPPNAQERSDITRLVAVGAMEEADRGPDKMVV